MSFTDDQRRAIDSPGSIVVVAGAGSGKTRVLVERYVRLVSAGDLAPDAVLAITFTEKAAREMRERVRAAVEARARRERSARWEGLRAAVESARIGTIHGFCAELLRAHPGETGLDPRFRILDEVESGLLIAAGVDDALRAIADEGRPAINNLRSAISQEFGPAELRATLAELLRGGGELRAALASLPAEAEGLRGLWRSSLRQAQAEALGSLVAGAAWRQAADVVAGLAPVAPADDRLGALLIAVAAWLAGDLQAPPPLDGFRKNLGSKRLWAAEADLAAAREAMAALRDLYGAEAELLAFAPDDRAEARAAEATLALRDLYGLARASYAARKASADALDFDDLEALARDLLAGHPHVRRRWRAELRAIMVDEFQDTNEAQRAIIYALAGLDPAADDGPPAELFVVGDGKQSIYRFRGADVSVFRAVEADLAGRGGLRVPLGTSFRSHPGLLGWVNRVGAQIFARAGQPRPFETPFEPLRASRPPAPHPTCVELHVSGGAASVGEGRDAEAERLARRLRSLVEGAGGPLVYDREAGRWRAPGYGDIALLFRASGSFEPFEAALRAQRVPFLTTAGRGYYGRREVQDLIHLLRAIDDPADELALVGALRSPLFALDDATIVGLRLGHPRRPGDGDALGRDAGDSLWEAVMGRGRPSMAPAPLTFAAEVLAELHAMRGRVTVAELLREALGRTGYLATISGLEDGDRRRVNVEKLVAAARLSAARGLPAFSEYLEQLLRAETREGEAPLEGRGSVRLMTIHRSKGLEFPIVALPDLGRTPPPPRGRWLARPPYGLALRLRDDEAPPTTATLLARRAEAQMERAEGERLLYVAMTRAQDYLLLSGPALRHGGESWMGRVAAALGHPWEGGGPPAGERAPLVVLRHDAAPEHA